MISIIRYIIVLVVFVSLSDPIQAIDLHQMTDFSISLPDEWVEIPRDVIDTYEEEISNLAPNAPIQHYDYGFQLGSTDKWFEYPYILIQVNKMGRIPESQIEKLEKYSLQESFDEKNNNLSSIMSDIKVGKMYYDNEAKIIWLRIESNVVDVGHISGLAGMIPSEKGFFQVSGYSLKDDYSTYEPIFRAITVSVVPSIELVYNPRWTNSLPPVVSSIDWNKVLGEGIVGAITGVFLALIVGVFSWIKKKKN